MIRMYLIDHGAAWASRVGDVVARPFAKLEAWCNREWWEYSGEQRREYTRRFYPNEP